jgi:ParB family chromosome partitioning protein
MLDKDKKNSLGKGMAALLGDFNKSSFEYFSLPIDKIEINKNQPRKTFSKKELEELSSSIKEYGIIQPLVVRRRGSKYELIAGERRLRAAILASLVEVPVILKEVEEDKKLILSLIENIQRENLNILEEAEAYAYLIKQLSLTQEELAVKVGKERSTITNFLRILKLPTEIKFFIKEGVLSLGHGKVLLSLNNEKNIIEYGKLAVKKNFSVKDLNDYINKTNITRKHKVKVLLEQKFTNYKQKIERKTGLKIECKANEKNQGYFSVHFHNQELFDKICQFFLKNKIM